MLLEQSPSLLDCIMSFHILRREGGKISLFNAMYVNNVVLYVFSGPLENEKAHLEGLSIHSNSFSKSMSSSSWCCPFGTQLVWHEGKPCVGERTLSTEQQCLVNNAKWPAGEGNKADCRNILSRLGSSEAACSSSWYHRLVAPPWRRWTEPHWVPLPLPVCPYTCFVCLVLCHLESLYTARAYPPPPPHRWTQHVKPGGLMQRVSGALWILRRQREG